VDHPDPTPVIRIPEIQYHPKPLEDNSHPTRLKVPPIPDPQFKVGQLVQWAQDNYSDQGQIASAQYDGLWVYEVKESGSIELVSLAENRLSAPDIALPFKVSIIGREVQVFDSVTGELMGSGAVEKVELKSEEWEYLIRRGNCGSFEATDVRLVLVSNVPQRCITMAQPDTFTPIVLPTPTPAPTPAPDAIPIPEPDRDYEKGFLVRWVVGGGGVHQGGIIDYHLDANNKWVYDIAYGGKGSVWKALEQNRVLLVTSDSLPYQTRVEGYPVKFIDLATGSMLGEGIVEGGEQMAAGWEYDILVGTCEVIRPPAGSRLVLVQALANPFECEGPASTPVPTVEPTPVPVPTQTPIPTTEPDPTDRPELGPTPTPTTEPPATPEPTPEPTEEPTPTPEPQRELYTALLTVEATQGATGSYTYTDFTVDFVGASGDSFSFSGGIIDTEEEDYVYIASDSGADCYSGGIPTIEQSISWPGCLSALPFEAEGSYEVHLITVPPEIDAAWSMAVFQGSYSEDGTRTLLVADLGGQEQSQVRSEEVRTLTACGDFFENPPGYAECE
jgi:hypothetical protein